MFAFLTGPAFGQGYKPDEAAGKMTTPAGFVVELVAAEPLVRQPVAIDFDERGRLWVMQYLQYPNPAGLKRVKVDRYSRTVYDRVPEPPPRGPVGADKLTILEPDSANPGRLKARDFVAGLNLASGFAFGHGGVFILQAPYLLFYPDRNRDDVPDGDPDVLLTGFGMEDAHSVANSLTWGPDGWLYGCQGSTVTANIRGIEFQQGVWRYHPLTRRFELFCEGGGNSWGLDFDRRGRLFYSTNFGPYVMLHGVQGGYYWKSFGKHGALHNPYAYGYFDHVPHENFRGGHVTVGGFFYRADQFPEPFRDKYIGADLLGHAVYWHALEPQGTSFRSRHDGELLLANDTWFAPSDLCQGPDGCVYIADWHDRRTAHPDPDADWDRSNGRIFRIRFDQRPMDRVDDLAAKPTSELIALLSHRNHWFANTARRILADRRDSEAILPLRTMVQSSPDEGALESLWALHLSGGLNAPFARQLLQHPNEHVRSWIVRLLGDDETIEAAAARDLVALSGEEPSAVVRSQLACTAKRLDAEHAIPMLSQLVRFDEDAIDPHIPMLLWWAVERHAISSMAEIVGLFANSKKASFRMVRETILPRLIRRYASQGSPSTDLACAKLLRGASGDRMPPAWLAALEAGITERPGPRAAASVLEPDKPTGERGQVAAPPLVELLRQRAASNPEQPGWTRILARLGDAEAIQGLLNACIDRSRPVADRVAAIAAFGDSAPLAIAGNVVTLVFDDESEPVRSAALKVWSRTGAEDQARALIDAYGRFPPAIRAQARSALLTRPAWSALLISAVEQGRIERGEFTAADLELAGLHEVPELRAAVRRIWGAHRGPASEEKLAEVRRLNNDVRAPGGDPENGKRLFAKHCGLCHKLFGEGGDVGPDLTHANRGDRQFLLVSIVDPGNVIRKEYLSHVVETVDGRVLTGIIAEQTGATLTLVNAKAEKSTLRRDEIERMRESSVSIMPDDIYRQLSPSELRDLFRYLQSNPGKP